MLFAPSRSALVPSSFLFLVAMPGATSSDALVPISFLFQGTGQAHHGKISRIGWLTAQVHRTVVDVGPVKCCGFLHPPGHSHHG